MKRYKKPRIYIHVNPSYIPNYMPENNTPIIQQLIDLEICGAIDLGILNINHHQEGYNH